MKNKEYEYYNTIKNWSFDDISYEVENYTNWDYIGKIKYYVKPSSRVLDLGCAAGEKILKYYPDAKEILGTDFSEEMIKSAKENLKRSNKKNVSFRVMDNLKMDTQDNYFDVVTCRHTVIDARMIYKTLKTGGHLILRGVDKMDCWALKRMFGRGQAFNDKKPISLIDYENILDAGFLEVELIPLHIIEYYKTKEDLLKLLLKVPILQNYSEEEGEFYSKYEIDMDIFEKYVKINETEKGIKLIRRYYGIIAKK
mgnify:CR=1 FL=1